MATPDSSPGDYRRLVQRAALLLHRTDPLGLGGSATDLPETEYEPQAAEIVRRLRRMDAPSASDATRVIGEVFEAAFGSLDEPIEMALGWAILTRLTDTLDVEALVDQARITEDDDLRWELISGAAWAGGPPVWPVAEPLLASDTESERILGFDLAGAVPHHTDEERGWWREQGSDYPDVDGLAPDHLSALGAAAGRELERSESPETVMAAVVAVGKQELAWLLPQVLAHRRHTDPDVREVVAVTLGSIDPGGPPPAAVDALVELGRDPVDDVRDWALFSLIGIDPIDTPETQAVFRENLNHPHEGVRGEATRALRLLGDVELLTQALETHKPVDPDDVQAAARSGDERLHQPLLALRERGWATDSDAVTAAHLASELDAAIAATRPRG